MKNIDFFETPDAAKNACGYCNKPAGQTLFKVGDIFGNTWDWTQCPSCGARSLTPRPTPEQLAVAYDPTYYGTGETKFVWPIEQFVNYIHDRRAKKVAKKLPANANVLDLGCGSGDFLASVGKFGSFNLHGIELPGGSAERAAKRPGIRLTVGTIVEANFPSENFDLITMFHVFEHLTEPHKTLQIVHQVLKSDGRLILSVPNISSVQAALFGPNWFHLDPPRHLFLMPADSFARAMSELGFAIERRRYFSLKLNPYGFIQSTLNCLLRQRDVLYERFKGNKTYAPSYGTGSFVLQALAAIALFPLGFTLDIIESVLKRGATVEYVLKKVPPGTSS